MKDRYGVACAACGHEFSAAPSMMMRVFGENVGAASCPACREYLHLEVEGGLGGGRMASVRHAEWLDARGSETLQEGTAGA